MGTTHAHMETRDRTVTVHVGTAQIICPVCDEQIPVPVSARVDDTNEDGATTLVCQPDMTDLWAHMWVHDQEEQ